MKIMCSIKWFFRCCHLKWITNINRRFHITGNQLTRQQNELTKERNDLTAQANELTAQRDAADKQYKESATAINQQLADETTRHNKEVESIQKDANAISGLIAEETKRHNQATEDLTRDYNEKYLAIQKAQGEERLRLQGELNNIQYLIGENDRKYKEMMAIYQGMQTEVAIKDQEEKTRHNKATEELSLFDSVTKAYQAETGRLDTMLTSIASTLNMANQRYNAITNRLSVVSSYELGVWDKSISAFNAETSRIRALNEQNTLGFEERKYEESGKEKDLASAQKDRASAWGSVFKFVADLLTLPSIGGAMSSYKGLIALGG